MLVNYAFNFLNNYYDIDKIIQNRNFNSNINKHIPEEFSNFSEYIKTFTNCIYEETLNNILNSLNDTCPLKLKYIYINDVSNVVSKYKIKIVKEDNNTECANLINRYTLNGYVLLFVNQIHYNIGIIINNDELYSLSKNLENKYYDCYILKQSDISTYSIQWYAIYSLLSINRLHYTVLKEAVIPIDYDKLTTFNEDNLLLFPKDYDKGLNNLYDEQKKILLDCIKMETGIYLIKGPPGTGKTTLIKEIINSLSILEYQKFMYNNVLDKISLTCKDSPKILVTSESNYAVLNIVKDIENVFKDLNNKTYKMNILILSSQERYKELDNNYKKYHILKLIEDFYDEYYGRDINKLIKEYENNIKDTNNYKKIKYYIDVIEKLKCYNNTKELRSVFIRRADIVFSTLAKSGSEELMSIYPNFAKFKTIIIDEAAHILEPTTLIPFNLGSQKCIMVGDDKQLPPTVINQKLKNVGYDISLFERLLENNYPSKLLNIQYRSVPVIGTFISTTFYNGNVKNGNVSVDSNIRYPFYLVLSPVNNTSNYYNDTEVKFIYKYYKYHINKNNSVGIITPYNEQKEKLYHEFEIELKKNKNLEIGTIDSFQGKEFDIVLMSLVKSNSDFINDIRRINVAISRAKQMFICVGYSDIFTDSRNTIWNLLYKYVSADNKHGTIGYI